MVDAKPLNAGDTEMRGLKIEITLLLSLFGLKLAICYFVDSVLPTARPKKIMTDQPKQTAGSPTNGLILRALNMILDNIVGQVYLQ